MRPHITQGVEVDLCDSCESLWLDAGEFDQLVAQRFAGMDFEDILALSRTEPAEARSCPRDATRMDAVFFQDIELDRCPMCAGVFLDGDDRAELRAQASRERDLREVQRKPSKPAIQSAIETDSLELDRPTASESVERVLCAGCQTEVVSSRCIRRMDAYWCESCVVAGDYPGGYGETIASRVSRAAQAMAQAEAKQKSAKRARDLRERNKDRITYYRGKAVRGSWTFEEYAVAFERAGEKVRHFFDKVRGKETKK